MLSSLLIMGLLCGAAAQQKILCLHGGGQSADSFRASSGMRALEASLPSFEFVYARGAYAGDLWIRDPPNGKGQPTTDPNWADASLTALDTIVAQQGPFFGILGYSQGSAFVQVYLAHAPINTFQVALLFCGYLPHTHTGLINNINAAQPFGDIPALVWSGQMDFTISNPQTAEQATVYTTPTIITSATGGHDVPSSSDSTYNQVVAFVTSQAAASPSSAAPTASAPTSAAPTASAPTASAPTASAPTWGGKPSVPAPSASTPATPVSPGNNDSAAQRTGSSWAVCASVVAVFVWQYFA